MWTRGQLRPEIGRNGEGLDVLAEFEEEIKSVSGFMENDGGVREKKNSSMSTSTPIEDPFERSVLIMKEERHIYMKQELTRHPWERRLDSKPCAEADISRFFGGISPRYED